MSLIRKIGGLYPEDTAKRASNVSKSSKSVMAKVGRIWSLNRKIIKNVP
ncbi:hypothetical protein B0O79_3521 [Flavobacteriaceae bacterium MAR_2009_75]|nr:hypothetical protein B0O79_3521 [Flavobacteriaceae bacterium MAR_2009_75]